MRQIVLIVGVWTFAGMALADVEVRRCVLDGQSRMIAVKLTSQATNKGVSNNLWASYSPATGTLIRCWSGGLIDKNGLKSSGDGHLSLPMGKPVWTIRAGDQSRPIVPRFLGYTATAGGVTFRYEVKTGPKERILIEESPFGARDPKSGLLKRSFKVTGVPADITLSVDVPIPTAKDAVETNGSLVDPAATYPTTPAMGVKTLLLRPNATTFISSTLRPGQGEDSRPSPEPPPETQPAHPSYAISSLNPPSLWSGIGDLDTMANGDTVVCTGAGDVFRVSGLDKPGNARAKKIASGLDDPRGIKVFGNYIYVLQREELTELLDNDKDGLYEEYRCINQGWVSDGSGTSLGLSQTGQLFGGVVKSRFLAELGTDGQAATKELPAEVFAIGTAPKGQRLFAIENQIVFASGEPVVDLPNGDRIGDIYPMPGTGQYSGQILVSSDRNGFGRIFLDRVGSEVQGAYIPVIKNFTGRFKINAKGVIVGGDTALHRLTPTSKGAFAIQSVRLRESGLEVWLNDSIIAGVQLQPSQVAVEAKGANLVLGPILVSKWRNRIFLPITGLKAGQLIHVSFPKNVMGTKGQNLWTTDFWYTARVLSSSAAFSEAGPDPSALEAGVASPPRKARSGPAPKPRPKLQKSPPRSPQRGRGPAQR